MKVNILRQIPWLAGNYFHPTYYDDDVFRMDACVRAGNSIPPHYHKHFNEHWLVRQGNPTFIVGKEKYLRKPGESFGVQRNEIHSFVAGGNEDVILATEIRPCGDMARMMSIIAGLQDDGEKNWLFKYFYIEKRAGLNEFTNPGNPATKMITASLMPVIGVMGRIYRWDKLIDKYI